MKKALVLLMALLMMLSCCACGWKNPELTEEQLALVITDIPQPEPEVARNPLTGEPLEDPSTINNRPVAVMLNNIHYAMPQHGLQDCDIIYEFVVEHGITRLMGVFHDVRNVGTIGSVRSARPYYIETVMGMEAIYVHAGGSDEAYYMLYDLPIDDFDEIDFDVFWRDKERRKTMAFEHTLMTSGERISSTITNYGWSLLHSEGYEYPFTYVEDGTPHSDTKATNVTVRFSDYKTGTFDYDPATGRYLVGQYDTQHVDGNTGEQLSIVNLLILRTEIYRNGDAAGHMVAEIWGSGEGTYICGGKAIPIMWHKETMEDPFTYTLADGTHFSLGIGNSYVCVIDTEDVVTIS